MVKTLLKILGTVFIGIGIFMLMCVVIALVKNTLEVVPIFIIFGILPLFFGLMLRRKAKKITASHFGASRKAHLPKLLKSFLYEYENSNASWQSFVNDNHLEKTKSNEKALKHFGIALYETTLSKAVQDLCITENETTELESIIKYFSIPENEVNKVNSSYAENAMHQLVKLKLSDRKITDNEKDEVYNFGTRLGIPPKAIDQIINNATMDIYKEYLASVSSDNRITPEEERDLTELANKLQLSNEQIQELLDNKTKESLLYYKLLYEIENGSLPVIEPTIVVQKNEVCYFSVSAKKLITKKVTRHIGSSVRLAKTSIRLYNSYPIQDEVTHIYPGTLTITNMRVVFTATEKSFSIPLSKIANLVPYKDGIGIQHGQTMHLLQFENNCTELVGLLIQTAIKKS